MAPQWSRRKAHTYAILKNDTRSQFLASHDLPFVLVSRSKNVSFGVTSVLQYIYKGSPCHNS